VSQSDWLAIVLAIIFAGVGAYMTSFSRTAVRTSGLTLIALGIAGAIIWVVHFGSADAQGPAAPSGNSGIIAPGQQGIITQGQTGNNYINKDPRLWGFLPDAYARFTASLDASDKEARALIQIRLSDKDSSYVAGQLAAAFKTVPGWSVSFLNMPNAYDPTRGIVVRLHDPNNISATDRAVINAFSAAWGVGAGQSLETPP
jgi:hypothetical protein